MIFPVKNNSLFRHPFFFKKNIYSTLMGGIQSTSLSDSAKKLQKAIF